MYYIGLLIVLLFGLPGVPAPGHHGASKFCYSCHNTRDPHTCTHVEKCGPEDQCKTSVHWDHAHQHHLFTMGCGGHHDCEHTTIIGKRLAHGELCRQCCATDRCNKKLCNTFLHTTTAKPLAACRNHEEDGFTCSMLGHHICVETTSLSHQIAWQKCPKYCGFCDQHGNYKPTTKAQTTVLVTEPPTTKPTTEAPTTAGHVDVVITQATTTQQPIVIVTDPVVPTKPQTDAPVTDPVVPTKPQTDAPATTQPTTAQPVTATTVHTTGAPLTASPVPACVDDERNGFMCASFDQFSFCTDPTSFAYSLAQEKCPKHCGYCGATTSNSTLPVTTTSEVPIWTTTTTDVPMKTTDDNTHQFTASG